MKPTYITYKMPFYQHHIIYDYWLLFYKLYCLARIYVVLSQSNPLLNQTKPPSRCFLRRWKTTGSAGFWPGLHTPTWYRFLFDFESLFHRSAIFLHLSLFGIPPAVALYIERNYHCMHYSIALCRPGISNLASIHLPKRMLIYTRIRFNSSRSGGSRKEPQTTTNEIQ